MHFLRKRRPKRTHRQKHTKFHEVLVQVASPLQFNFVQKKAPFNLTFVHNLRLPKPVKDASGHDSIQSIDTHSQDQIANGSLQCF